MSKYLDYEKEYHKALLDNIKNVREDLLNNDPTIVLKIENYAVKYDLPIDFIKHKILKDNIFAINFVKDPSKQTFHQNLAAKFISEIEGVEDFKTLPAGGKSALYIVNGILGTEDEVIKGSSKSIDFYWKYKDYECYAAHKYTDMDGGSQDNQYADLTNFLANASKSRYENKLFFAIGDGRYYQRKHTKTKNDCSSKIEYMNSLYKTEHSIAITTNDLERYLKGNNK